jgi:hypothetical protein
MRPIHATVSVNPQAIRATGKIGGRGDSAKATGATTVMDCIALSSITASCLYVVYCAMRKTLIMTLPATKLGT